MDTLIAVIIVVAVVSALVYILSQLLFFAAYWLMSLISLIADIVDHFRRR